MEKITNSPIFQNIDILAALRYLNTTGHLSDINIRVGAKDGQQQVFKCHKLILAVTSPYFEAMFFGTDDSNAEKNQTEIEIKDVEPDVFNLFLNYVYSRQDIDNVDQFSIETLQSFIYMGHKFLQPQLSQFGIAAIESVLPNLRLSDLLELFGSAYKVGHKHLLLKVSNEIKTKVADTTTFNPTLLNFDLSTFKALLVCVKGCVYEYTRFDWIEEYVNQKGLFVQEQNTKQTSNEGGCTADGPIKKKEGSKTWTVLLEDISYVHMDIKEFCKGPLKSKLLGITEKNNALIDIAQITQKNLQSWIVKLHPEPEE